MPLFPCSRNHGLRLPNHRPACAGSAWTVVLILLLAKGSGTDGCFADERENFRRHVHEGGDAMPEVVVSDYFQRQLAVDRASNTGTLPPKRALADAAVNVKQIIAHRGASAERPECTLAAIRRAMEIGATAVEVDVRTSRDGRLFILHDATLDRTTHAKGPANALTLKQLQQLDAGSWFDPAYRGERIPTLIEAAKACRRKIDLLLDLKEQGGEYDRQVARVVREHGNHSRTIVGVRSVPQALRFRKLLPEAKQLALIPSVDAIEKFAEAGVDTIRIWPRWLSDGTAPLKRVHATGKELHLNGTTGSLDETLALLIHNPDSLSSDDPGKLKASLKRIANGDFD